MKQHLLPQEGNLYKACLHVHTTCSDGLLTPEEIKKLYMEKGYSIVAYTDHEVIIPHNDLKDDKFLPITGAEIAINETIPGLSWRYGKQYHLNLLSKDPYKNETSVFTMSYVCYDSSIPYITEKMKATEYPRTYSNECLNDIIRRAKKEGFLVAYNHPVLSGQSYPDYIDLKGFWGVEVYNTGSVTNGHFDTVTPFVDMLRNGQRVFPLATDDMHGIRNAFGGWVMVKAQSLDYDVVMDALEKGDFYASTGPEIHALYLDGEVITIECSPSSEVMVRTERHVSKYEQMKGKPLTRVSFDLHDYFAGSFKKNMPCEPYFRVQIRDAAGNFAYTRAYFLDELEGISYEE